MAGRRRTAVVDGERPRTSDTKAENRRTVFLENLAVTRALRPSERIAAAQAYLRSTLAVLDHRNPVAAHAIADEVFDQLTDAAGRAWAALGVTPR